MFGAINGALTAFSAALLRSPLNGVVAGVSWIVPLVQVVHILAVAVLVGAAAMINLRALGVVDRQEPFELVLDRFLPPIAFALPVLGVTGFILIAGEPTRAVFRVVFWLKMALLTLASILTFSMRGDGRARAGGGVLTREGIGLRIKALAASALWMSVIVAGRWIGYATGWPGSPQ
jgi:hypothetical protein